MPLSDADQTRLNGLLAARDKLISGAAVAETEYAGQRTTYSKADMQRLDREIGLLQSAADAGGGAYGTVRHRI